MTKLGVRRWTVGNGAVVVSDPAKVIASRPDAVNEQGPRFQHSGAIEQLDRGFRARRDVDVPRAQCIGEIALPLGDQSLLCFAFGRMDRDGQVFVEGQRR